MAASVAFSAGRKALQPTAWLCSPSQNFQVGQQSGPSTFLGPAASQRTLTSWPRCSSYMASMSEGTLDSINLTLDISSSCCPANQLQHACPQGVSSFHGRHVYQLQSTFYSLPREQGCQYVPSNSGPRAFLEDDQPYPATVTQRDMAELSLRARLETRYSSQLGAGAIGTFGHHNLLQRRKDVKESFGGSPPGGGKNNGRGRGDGGGGGGGGGEGQTAIYLLPVLTLVFAAVFLGYAVAVGLKEEGMNMDFLRTSAGLFGLLALAAFRVNNQTGIDAFILGLGASTAVMVWTGERFVVRKEIAPAGIVTFLAASMAVIFTGALYHSL